MNVSCISVSETLCLEAARMAQSLGIHRVVTAANPNVLHGTQQVCYRTFWVVYLLERQVCFLTSRSPVSAILAYRSRLGQHPTNLLRSA